MCNIAYFFMQDCSGAVANTHATVPPNKLNLARLMCALLNWPSPFMARSVNIGTKSFSHHLIVDD